MVHGNVESLWQDKVNQLKEDYGLRGRIFKEKYKVIGDFICFYKTLERYKTCVHLRESFFKF